MTSARGKCLPDDDSTGWQHSRNAICSCSNCRERSPCVRRTKSPSDTRGHPSGGRRVVPGAFLESDHVHSARPVVGVLCRAQAARAAEVLVGAHAHVVAAARAPPRAPRTAARHPASPWPGAQSAGSASAEGPTTRLPERPLVMPMLSRVRRELKLKYISALAEAGDLHNLCI